MTKRLTAYLLLGVSAYLLFLLWTFPADRAAALLHARVPQLQLTGVTGSAWSGRAATLQYQTQTLSRFKWQLQPLALLKGRLGFAIAFDGDGQRGSANVALQGGGTVDLSEVDATLPMDKLATLLGIPVSLSGLLEAKFDELAFKGGVIQRATGQLHWRHAALTAPVERQLGDFSAQVSSEAAGIKARIRDEGGPLQLEGTVRLIGNGSYQFNAKAAVRDPQQTLLRQALQAAGRQGPDGRVMLEYSGRL